MKAVARAADIAGARNASLIVVCAYHPMSAREQALITPATGDATARVTGTAAAQEALDRGVEHAREAGAPQVEGRLVEGDAVEALLSVAQERSGDLIVLGNRGINTLSGRLLGSGPWEGVQGAPCAVLIFHTPGGRGGWGARHEPRRACRLLAEVDGEARPHSVPLVARWMVGRVRAVRSICAHGWWPRSTRARPRSRRRSGSGCRCTRWGRYAARRPPTGSVAPMHAWLPASLAAADVTVAAHAAAFAAETGDSCRWRRCRGRSPAGRSSKSLNTTSGTRPPAAWRGHRDEPGHDGGVQHHRHGVRF